MTDDQNTHSPAEDVPVGALMSADTPLSQAKEFILTNIDEGVLCPCCGQNVKRYHRALNAGQARSMIRMYALSAKEPGKWLHVREIGSASREEGKLVFWGLVEAHVNDKGKRDGMWRLTPQGRAFVEGRISVPSHVWIFNGTSMGLDAERMVTISDVLSEPFDINSI